MEFIIAGSLFFLSPKGTLVMGEDVGKKILWSGLRGSTIKSESIRPTLEACLLCPDFTVFHFQGKHTIWIFFLQDIKGV